MFMKLSSLIQLAIASIWQFDFCVVQTTLAKLKLYK